MSSVRQPPLLPRKTPRQARSRATVDVILDGAAHILETEGEEGFNTNRVAAVAGVSVGTLYQYFPGKEAVLAALIDREQDQRAQRLDALAAAMAGADLPSLVRALVQAAVAGETERPRLSRLLDAAEARLGLDRAATLLDPVLARILCRWLPAEAALAHARTLRVVVRAIIDDALNAPDPDDVRALREAERVALACLRPA
jgi:AcrR family transcriptional regulator